MTTDPTNPPPALLDDDHLSDVADRLATIDGLLFCTDFDGTLAAIAEDPDAPELTPANRDALETLRDHDRVRVAVISGRELADLRPRVGIDGIDYAGNHGLEIHRDAETTVHPVAEKRRKELEAIVAEIEDRLADTDCFVEDKSVSATVHYRAAPELEDEVHEIVESAVERVAPSGFELSVGKEIVELTPAIAWDKGRALSLLAAEYEGWLSMYIGDDTTDEAAFRALGEDGIAVHVGSGEETVADYRIENPATVERFLDWLSHTGLDALDAAEEPNESE
ncbi:MAG TPA: trehalose-phosphatase [Halococcus sp.]|nr:trehalose-phosphatase [Halococcus sp.]